MITTGIDQVYSPSSTAKCSDLLATLVVEADFTVVPVRQFPEFIAEVLENIVDWADGEKLPDEVLELLRTDTDALQTIQRDKRYTRLRIYLWQGEMKLQISEARRAAMNHFLGRQASMDQTGYGEDE